MIKMQELKTGAIVLADYDGEKAEGIVKSMNNEEKQVCVQTAVQDFNFRPEQLYPIPLNEEQLLKLNFEKQENEDGSVKYIRGPFRVFLPEKDNFSKLEVYYREDRRHLTQRINVHELQNHYLQMTKVNLTRS